MLDRIYSQMQAMQVLNKTQEVTADNLANINTPGFKGNKVFYRMLREEVNGKITERTVPMQQVNMEQGVLEPTGNQFDLGINGEGFFKVEDGDNTFLTRDGRFNLDQDGFLVNKSGHKVMGEAGPILLAEYFQSTGTDGGMPELKISKDGTIRLNGKIADKLSISKVSDPALLERKGNSYFSVKGDADLIEENAGTVMQGYYEKGNVQPLNEMVDMMRTMQTFESQQKAMRTTDEMLSRITQQLGRF